MDFSSAFDKVPHKRILYKLHYYGIRCSHLGWTEDFLVGRTQQGLLESKSSSTAPVQSGVPQRSVLGPLRFLLFINDLPDIFNLSEASSRLCDPINMCDMLIIIALVSVVYTAMLVIWLSPKRIMLLHAKLSALLIQISSDFMRNPTASFVTVGLCFWILAVQIDHNQTKNKLINIETTMYDIEEYVKSSSREMKKMEKRFETLLETEIFMLRADCRKNLRVKIQKLNNKILLKIRDTDEILEDLGQRTIEVEQKVRKGQNVFRHLKDYFKKQSDKNNQLDEDVHSLYQRCNHFLEEREEHRFHEKQRNQRHRDVAQNHQEPSLVVRVINKAIDVVVGTVGTYLAGSVFKAVSWVGSWLGLT